MERLRKRMVEINEDRVGKLSRIISRLGYNPVSFDSPDLFPENDEFIYPNYLFFLIAIDHRTHPLPRRFEGIVDGKFYHGSDLLFALARKAQKKEPDLFTAKKMVKVTEGDIARIFSAGNVTIKNPAERAYLLRDCAQKLIDNHQADFRNLLIASEGYLIRYDQRGVLQQLKKFRAYKDPLMKKSYLLIKILKRQGYLKPVDIENLSFPIDDILMEVALRSGLLEIPMELENKVLRGLQLSADETEFLRKATRKSFEMVSKEAEIPPDVLDDLIWAFGREVNKIGSEDELGSIRTTLDDNIQNKKALEDFLVFIGGFDRSAPFRLKLPETWYF
jgi:hypothetical protein